MKELCRRWLITSAALIGLSACGGGSISNNSVAPLQPDPQVTSPLGGRVESFTPLAFAAAPAEPKRAVTAPIASARISLGPIDGGRPSGKLTLSGPAAAAKAAQVAVGRQMVETSSHQRLSELLVWQTRADGRQIAALRLASAGATGLRLGISVTRLDASAVLRIYSPSSGSDVRLDGAAILQSITRDISAAPRARQLFFTPYIEGQEVILEISLPQGSRPEDLRISVPLISHFFESPEAESLQAKIGESGICQVDVICKPEWTRTADATARIIFTEAATGTSFACTATLLNDRYDSGTPYLLTANHCISDQQTASSVQTFWFYRAPSCGAGSLNPSVRTVTGGATLLYASASTDTTLMRLLNPPPPGVTFHGWSAESVPQAAGVTSIYHPRADLQKISLGTFLRFNTCRQESSGSFTCSSPASNDAGSHLRVTWSTGAPEPGSSGAGLFESLGTNRYLVGQLSAGTSSCSNPRGDDVYGRFDIAYREALFKWLDNRPGSEYVGK